MNFVILICEEMFIGNLLLTETNAPFYLCYRLNEDSKVLSPEELLYRCVEAVNFTHNPKAAQMDIKLR